MLHYALGDGLVRQLTLASRSFFDEPPDDFGDQSLGTPMPVLVFAREDERPEMDALAGDIAPFARLEQLDAQGVENLCPLLKDDARYGIADFNGIRLDPHALLQGFLRQVRARQGQLHVNARVTAIQRGEQWEVSTAGGESFEAPILINAAGAWGDTIARLAGIRPLGLEPKRRTIITFDAPESAELAGLPFAKTVRDELYFAPESGRLFASPMDEVPTDPCDAQPDDYEVALAAYRMEERTTIKVERVHSKWAGLRTFAPDRHPVCGFAENADGFFWLVGQGGFGLQTSPVMAEITASLIGNCAWPVAGISASDLSPDRFRGEVA